MRACSETRWALGHVWAQGRGFINVERIGSLRNSPAGVGGVRGESPPPPLDQLQHRSVIEHQRADSGIGWIPAAERRGDDRWHAQSQQRFAVHKIGIYIVGGGGSWRHDVLEKAAPFVKVHDEDCVGPLW